MCVQDYSNPNPSQIQPSGTPGSASDWSYKGADLFSQGKYGEALQAFNRATEIDPQFAAAWTGKGYAFKALGRYDEAVLAFDKAIEINPQDAEARNDKDQALKALGRTAEAEQVCIGQGNAYVNGRCIPMDQYNQTAQRCLDRGGVLNNNYECMIPGKAIEINPNDANARDDKTMHAKALAATSSIATASVNFTNVNPDIFGTVFEDQNGNRLLDNNEPGIRGFTVELQLAPSWDVFSKTTTSSDGRYAFKAVPKNDYLLVVLPNENWILTQGDNIAVPVSAINGQSFDFPAIANQRQML